MRILGRGKSKCKDPGVEISSTHLSQEGAGRPVSESGSRREVRDGNTAVALQTGIRRKPIFLTIEWFGEFKCIIIFYNNNLKKSTTANCVVLEKPESPEASPNLVFVSIHPTPAESLHSKPRI